MQHAAKEGEAVEVPRIEVFKREGGRPFKRGGMSYLVVVAGWWRVIIEKVIRQVVFSGHWG
jgi:hypothetical protein